MSPRPKKKRNKPNELALLEEETQADVHRQTREAHVTELAEDYVEAIADLIEAHGEARAVDLARRFGVSHVSVTKTIARLKRAGLVSSEPYRAVFLTEKGHELAMRCRKRHQVVRDFLLALGVSSKTAEVDAEGIEHHVSSETLQAFRRFISSKTDD